MDAIRIAPLNSDPDTINTLVRMYLEQWPDWYGPDGPGDGRGDLESCLGEADALPSCLVAYEVSGQVLGSVCLRWNSPGSDRHPGAWMTGLLVEGKYRNAGVGTALVAAAEKEARRLEFSDLHASTSSAGRLLMRRAWREIDETTSSDVQLKIYRKAF